MSQIPLKDDSSTGENTLTRIGKIHWKIFLIGAIVIILGGVFGMKYLSSWMQGDGFGGSTASALLDTTSDGGIKIPYDTKTLNLALDTAVDPLSITPLTVTLSPLVEGKATLSTDNRTISYTLTKPLEVGESYELRVASTVKKTDGTSLEKDKTVTFRATSSAQATKIFPTGTLDTLSQNITVVFNLPMVPMTNLDERDKLPCPLTITPKIEGKCVWTNTSILEFIPSSPLVGATRYNLIVADIPGLLHTLKSTLTGEIMTTPLRVSLTEKFSPLDGLSITTNTPVSTESLMNALELSDVQGSTALPTPQKNDLSPPTVSPSQPSNIPGQSIGFVLMPEKNEDGTVSETRFVLIPKDKKFTYSSDYMVKIRTSLAPKYGTEPLGQEIFTTIRTSDFVTGIEAHQNTFDNSGTLVDTKSYGDMNGMNGGIIPSEQLFFLADFDREIGLDNSLIVFKSKIDNSVVQFDLAYGKESEYGKNGEIIKTFDNKKQLKITPKSSLKKDADYEITFLAKANTAMTADETRSWHTAPGLIASDFKLISNTQGCIYTNNKIAYSYGSDPDAKSRISTTPSSRTPTVSLDYGEYVWTADGRNYAMKYVCPTVAGKNAYIVDMRLNPELAYKIDFLPAFADEYGQGLTKAVSFSFKTGKIAEKDKYIYSSAAGNQTQVIPSSLPIVLGMLSVNTDETNIEVCEMNQAGYVALKYQESIGNWDSVLNCENTVTKKISLKNRYWTVTPTKIDIEKEILGHAFATPFVFVRGYLGTYSRDNPKQFSHLFIRSNLSLTLENAANKTIIFASSYDGKSTPADLKFDGYRQSSTQYEKISNLPISWDPTKQVYVLTDTGVTFDILVAKNANSYGVINTNHDATSNYDFKYISGQDASSRDYLYIYGDRPLYQLSDTVYFKGVLRNYNFDGYHPTAYKKGKLRVIGGQGSISGEAVIAEMDVNIDANSNFHGEFTIPKSAPLGRYAFEFSGYEQNGTPTFIYNNGEFFIEAYKKPVFKVITEMPKSDAMVGDTVDVKAHAEYYFGGALAGAEYQYSVLSQSYYFDAREYRDYSFSNGSAYMDCLYWGACEYHDALESSGTGRLDAKGDGSVHYEYKKGTAPGEQIYTYSVEVTDPDTGKTVNHSVSQILHVTDGYVGIRAPYWNTGKNGIKLTGVVLDYDAKGLAGKTVGLELIKREWKNVKKEGVDGVFYNEGMIEETLIDKDSVKSNAQGEYDKVFLSATGGEYEIRASYTGSNGVAFVSSIYAYVAGDDVDNYWYEGNNTVADITADKTILAVGDTAGFTLKTPIKSGKMLVSIEKDDGILDYYLQDITDTTMRIEFPILDTYIPNVYVKVFALGQNPGEKLPTYKRALSVVKVLPDPKKLSVTVTAEKKQYLPGEAVKITVVVKDAKGNGVAGVNGSLGIVDESLLALAGNPQKNPFAYFYDMKRYLGVVTYTSLLNLVQKLEIKDTSLGEKGGAGEGQKGGLSKKKRGVFKDTAYWQADFTTDKDGKYMITTPALPDNLTTWVIEALVNTKKSEVGVGATYIQTTKTVLINDNLPRFLGTSDTVEIAPVVFNKTDKDATFDVSVEASNVTLNKSTEAIAIKAGSQVAVPFELSVASIEKIRHLTPQASKITIKAVSRVTGDLDIIEVTLPIIETSTREIVSTSGRADPTADELIELQSAIRNNGGSLDIRYAATLLPGLLSGLDFLANYPYGCIEQKLATIMPQVYLKELYDSIGVPYDLSKKMVQKYISAQEGYIDIPLTQAIKEVVESVEGYQRYDGGFGYWVDSPYSDLRLTLSVVARLQDLARIGFVTSSAVPDKASKYIKDIFAVNKRPYCVSTDCRYSLTERLDMIAGVLDANPADYEAYKMYQVLLPEIEKGDDSSNLSAVYNNGVDWSLSYAQLLTRIALLDGVTTSEKNSLKQKTKEILKKIGNENLVMNPRGSFIGRSTNYSRLANTLRFVETITLVGGDLATEDRTLLDQMGRWIMSQKKSDGSFGSTMDTTDVIRSITNMERATGEIRNINLESSLSLDGTALDKKKIDSTNKLEVFSRSLTLDVLRDISKLHFEKIGTGRIYYDIALQYAIPAKDVSPRDEGFYLESEYYDYASYQAIERAKRDEWQKYLLGEMEYADLEYPKDIVAYISPLKALKVGELVLAYNRMITGEPRDQVAFEGFIPAGSELVNPNLKTESQDVRNADSLTRTLFDHEEWQNDRYFATTRTLDPGVYTFNYIFRPTHVGTYELKPSRLSEFYNGEVFGRTRGKSISIVK